MQLPEAFLNSMQALLSDGDYQHFLSEMQQPAHAFVRMNRAKSLQEMPLPQVEWCPEGYVLKERPLFTADPLFHAGTYYVQEQSSMFLSHMLRFLIKKPVTMIDFCASPGGKSTLALSLLPTGSTLIANEPIRSRAQVLAENITKWGAQNCIVTNNYPQEIAATGLTADIILVDAPCSGEGMFRKDPDNIGEWSQKKVHECQQLQRSILQEAWNCLNENGYLIYSTCTFNTLENEENLKWFTSTVNAEVVEIPIPSDWNICGSLLKDYQEPVYRFIPGVGQNDGQPFGEGLFMAVLQKKEPQNKAPKRLKDRQQPLNRIFYPWLMEPDHLFQTMIGNTFVALPEQLLPSYSALAALTIMHAGIPLATQKGKDLIPHHALAMSTALQRTAFPEVALTKEEAIQYLRREAITLPDSTPKGFVFVSYDGHPLGFCKHLGNRSNNLYPQEWRIRKTL